MTVVCLLSKLARQPLSWYHLPHLLMKTIWYTFVDHLFCVHSGMKSTGRSIEPCSSWTARWREMRCYATKPSQRGNRGTGKGGGDRKQKRQWTRLPIQHQRGWMLTRLTTRWSALSAPRRWPCLTKTRFITSSTSWPATAEANWVNSKHDAFRLQSVCFWLLVSPKLQDWRLLYIIFAKQWITSIYVEEVAFRDGPTEIDDHKVQFSSAALMGVVSWPVSVVFHITAFIHCFHLETLRNTQICPVLGHLICLILRKEMYFWVWKAAECQQYNIYHWKVVNV